MGAVDLDWKIVAALERIADAQERIAAADERRNELLVADSSKRDSAWDDELELRKSVLRFAAGEPYAPTDGD